ncbi:dienelactone hydrolase family protein [Micromonospora sp. NPDC000207]|uniref:alpha/beta hydrolase family protein n=1 Tax=Micromonospora sp. NPDC000207 TaxID=3154246 RepID=UPI00333035DF
MFRRRALALVTTAVLTATAAGCSTEDPPAAPTETAPPPTSAAAPTPQVSPTTAPTRTHAVGVRRLDLSRGEDRPLPTTVWYPARGERGGEPERGAPVAKGKFPVVVFSHGLGGRSDDYSGLLSRWAEAGFVVAAPTFPRTSGDGDGNVLDVLNQPADVSYVLDEVLALDDTDGDPLRGRLDTGRVAAAGHSAGGVTTIGLFTTRRDDRLDAGVVFAGTAIGFGTAFAGSAAPQLFVHGELDDVVKYTAGKAVYDKVPWPKAMLSLPEGDHGRRLLSNDATLGVVSGTTVEFLRWSLYGDPAARERMTDGATRDGLATLDDQL